MGVLALDIGHFGAVMSADSQPVQILHGSNRVIAGGSLSRNPIVRRVGGGFRGLTGFVGTETIDEEPTGEWLEAFGRAHPDASVGDYSKTLAAELTRQWQRHGLSSVLEIFVSGVEGAEVRFWYVRNSQGLYDQNFTFKQPSSEFRAVDDLDQNYIGPNLKAGQSKEQLLQTRLYSFRQGVLLPAAPVFDAFTGILATIYAQGIEGFEPVASLNDLAYLARQRLEFLKRLYSAKHGIYKKPPAPVDGIVHVYGVSRHGEIREYGKHRNQVRILPLSTVQ